MELLLDTRLIFGRYMRQLMRNKIALTFGVLQPLLYLGFFGPLLTRMPGSGALYDGQSVWQGFVPGMLVMLGLFGSAFAGFGIIGELRLGVVERMRVTPASRLALLMGRIGTDVVRIEMQAVLLLLAAFGFGLRAPVFGILISLGILGLITGCIASLSYAIALFAREENSFAPLLNAVLLPLVLLSGILLPMSLAPGWLNALAHMSPFLYVVNGLRDAFVGDYGSSAMLVGLFVTFVFTAVSLTVGALTFRRENA
ncbi:ABC-2 type transport system permease protein [Actinopolyspora biskrensis]|uniref:Transport permease protein n=1 Tax=Actinopolyspora biskrensis TaxID=1470178 RepID=A0A852ZBM6_9ACTN|nr:ABC transporter permease [Actinopolyspora biskrensis]NYH80916.1 ABC-2 type transport system permease protein [Actinopolyspora biskrensis]